MENKRILISGAGIAGPALAYWLRQYGFSPTLIERAPILRKGGYKIDIRGVALEVVKRMGIHSDIFAARTDIRGASFVDSAGRQIVEMSGNDFGLRSNEDLEIVRGDLCQILMSQIEDVECLFGDSITDISQDAQGVRVKFEKNTPRTFDIVVGADGLHSTVRKLVFGTESHLIYELGLYLAIFTIPNYLGLDRWEIEYIESNKWVNLYHSRGNTDAKAAFAFSSPPLDFDPYDTAQQQQLLSRIYAGIGWEVPRLLEAMKEAPDFYFDSISQVCMDRWSDNRIVLLGDASYCPSPASGQGTSLALVGAYILAGELAAASGDYTVAFAQYEKHLRPYVEQNQKLAAFTKNMLQNKFLIWLNQRLMQILPGKWRNFIAKQSIKRVRRAANAITLKDYLYAFKNKVELADYVMIVVTVPETHAGIVREAMSRAGAGKIGDYSQCSYSVKGIGRFVPNEGSHPHLGQENVLEEVVEERIETICSCALLDHVLEEVKKVHPYEETVITIQPIHKIGCKRSI